jgi:serine/threonine-protein kinase
MGEDEVMGLFLVFEYVPGPRADGPESLRDRLRDGPLPLAEVAKLARELGSALTFAHAAGVIHRDIKPENILFSRNGSKIADFGIARIPDSTITRVNTVLGTPAYTSPEALSTGDFGPASDQFAFAATLYEAATGVRAFGGDDPIVTAGKVSSEPPPPLDPAIGTPIVVRSLGAALSKGVAKEVIDRFASCVDLGEAVARAILRPSEAGPAIDAMLEAASAPHLDDNGPASDRIELERTPLSSRVVLERKQRSSIPPALTPYGETPARPSIIIRKQTNRWQNLIAAGALIVIVVLVVVGKKQRDGVSLQDAAKGLPSASASVHPSASAAPTPTPHASVKRTLRAHPVASAAAAASVDASAPSPSSTPSARDE